MSQQPTGSKPGMQSAENQMQGWLLINGKRVPVRQRTPYQEQIRNLLDQSGPIVQIRYESNTSPPPKVRHSDGCLCVECHNAGLRYGDWLKQKRLDDL